MVIPAIFHKYEQKCLEAKPSKQVRSKCTIKSKKFEKAFVMTLMKPLESMFDVKRYDTFQTILQRTILRHLNSVF